MLQKLEHEISEKKEYVSVLLEVRLLQRRDVVMESMQDPNADNDANKDDIFG